VLSARTVKKLGVGLLDELNFGARSFKLRKSRHFATGGLVEGEAQPGARGELTATIALSEGLVLKELTTDAGLKAILKLIKKNPRAVRAALSTG